MKIRIFDDDTGEQVCETDVRYPAEDPALTWEIAATTYNWHFGKAMPAQAWNLRVEIYLWWIG